MKKSQEWRKSIVFFKLASGDHNGLWASDLPSSEMYDPLAPSFGGIGGSYADESVAVAWDDADLIKYDSF